MNAWSTSLLNFGVGHIYRPPVVVMPEPEDPKETANIVFACRAAAAKSKERREREKREIVDYIKREGEVTRRAVALRFHFSEGKTAELLTILRKEKRIVSEHIGTSYLWHLAKK